MSGAGKSSVVAELRRRGLDAHDVDEGLSYLEVEDGRWHWDVPRVRELLRPAEQPVFIAGCSEEQGLFQWDRRIRLAAPADVLMQRIDTRTSGFGKASEERALVLADIAAVEPLLHRSADAVVDATRPLREVVDAVLRGAGLPLDRG